MKTSILNSARSADGTTLEITIFGVVDPAVPLEGDTLSSAIAAQLLEHKDAARVVVRINSLGGDAFGGVAIYNLLREHPAAKAGQLECIVEGLAASAASVIAMAGRTVMGTGAMLMIHNPWSLAVGDAEDLREQANVLDGVQESLVAIYEAKTGKSRDELKALLHAETWLTAQQAVDEGFADEVSEGAAVQPFARGESILVNAVAFPRASVPAPILAMAVRHPEANATEPSDEERERPAVVAIAGTAPRPSTPPANEVSAVGSIVPELQAATRVDTGPVVAVFTAADVRGAESRALAAERERIKAIFALDLAGHAELVQAAIVDGFSPEQTIMAVYRAEQATKLAHRQATAAHLQAMRTESQILASVRQAPPPDALAGEVAAIRLIVGKDGCRAERDEPR